ncbi:putative ABC transporter permease, partial [Paenibacillus sp. 598K]|uniref:WD40 repeat domain-containing protein n=1 Tax=Paenibacillus sp. 598K TaxID=1117987 RepID=UPI000FFAA496
MRRSAVLSAALSILLCLILVVPAAASDLRWSVGDTYITSLAVRGDGEAVAVGTYDATASVYDATGERQLEFIAGNVVTGVTFLEDGSLLVSSDDRQLYRIAPDASVVWSLPLRRAVTGVAASQDGSRVLALLKGDPKAYLFDQDGQPQGELEIGIQPRKADLSDNGEWIALGGSDQYVYVIDGELEQVGKHSISGTIDALTITDEGRVVVGSSTGSVVILEPDGRRIEFSAADAVTAVAATADGRYIAGS